MTERIQLQQAFILHTRQYKNTSLLVDFFTRDYGRTTAIIKGARRPSFRQRGILQPFTLLLISWVGKHELVTATQLESALTTPNYLSGQALMKAFYLNELIMRVLKPRDVYTEVFDDYKNTIEQFGQGEHSEKTLRLFEKNLLEAIGYGLPLQSSFPSHEPIEPQSYYEYFSSEGFKWAGAAEHLAEQGCFLGASLLSLARGELEDLQSLKDAKRLMRMALRPHLGDKPLKSRELFVKV